MSDLNEGEVANVRGFMNTLYYVDHSLHPTRFSSFQIIYRPRYTKFVHPGKSTCVSKESSLHWNRVRVFIFNQEHDSTDR